MLEKKELIQMIGQAKAYIDNGLCRVGPKLDPQDAASAVLAGGASRALALADAVAALCRQNRPAEALPILRHLAETAVRMNWVANDTSRAEEALKDLEAERWELLWPTDRLLKRAEEAGMKAEDLKNVVQTAASYARNGLQSAPWTHAFERNKPASGGERALELAVRLMGHVLAALDRRWPESFPGKEAMWAS